MCRTIPYVFICILAACIDPLQQYDSQMGIRSNNFGIHQCNFTLLNSIRGIRVNACRHEFTFAPGVWRFAHPCQSQGELTGLCTILGRPDYFT